MKVDGRDGRDPQNRKKNAPAGRFTCMNIRTPSPIHFKFHKVIGIDGLTVCILMVKFRIFIPELWDFIHKIVGDFSYVAL